MEITVYQAKEAIVCPTSALINLPGRTWVLLRRGDGKYERREIELGLQRPDQVEVLEGLFPGDRVVVTGTKLLASMFHTGQSVATGAVQGQRHTTSDVSVEQIGTPVVPVVQAIVELPTSGKALATPVIEGRIAAIHTQPGESVEAGQLLAELDSQQLRSLQLELLEIQGKLRRINETLQHVEPLSRSGSFPQAQLWGLELQQRNSEMALQNVERKLAMVGLSPEAIDQLRRVDLSQSDTDVQFYSIPIRAPIAGRVADFAVVPGQIVHANDAVFEVQDPSMMWATGYVFEQHAAKVEVGQRAEIQIPAYPEMRLSGHVVRVAPTLHASARALPVWIEVENLDHKLREGMLANIQIYSHSANGQVAARAQNQN